MKKVKLPDIKFAVEVKSATKEKPAVIEEISAAQQLLLIVTMPPRGQLMTVLQMRDIHSLVDKLRKARGRSLLLEDEEYKLLLPAITTAGWGGYSEQAMELMAAVEEAKDAEVKVVEEAEDVEAKDKRRRKPRQA